MEVAGQWRREWAGAAEYGKVTEGGVTRRVARAMEVVQASGPGTRVRHMRAAWHASTGPGAGASYMMHSSRRVISSGSNHLLSPSLVSKPLEISSIPLDISSEGCMEENNYKVSEPDDNDISEPSKWKGSTGKSSVRMPSEESSSADNASVADLDSKLSSLHSIRKLSMDSENSDICNTKKRMSSTSPLLDAPVSLSTLKFKSLLNNTTENWHDRRKSYSFEKTSLNEKELYKSDTAMESSTDSGICKSSEVVNENIEEDKYQKHSEYRASQTPREETFKDWLARNRPKQIFKGAELKPHREYRSPERTNLPITLQSKGKVSITLSNNNNSQDDNYSKDYSSSDDADRKMKKVEFCKTELHFAAESGKVNIIATDEKPPSTNDFRKRKSAFVPIQGNFEKPITLFGEKFDKFTPIDDPIPIKPINDTGNKNETEEHEIDYSDDNLTGTKSILKNRIPKPKPYFLGENVTQDAKCESADERDLHTFNAVSLINEQLQKQQKLNSEKVLKPKTELMHNKIINDDQVLRKITSRDSFSHGIVTEKCNFNQQYDYEKVNSVSNLNNEENSTTGVSLDSKTIRQKLKVLQASPVMQPKHKTRQLRDSELTYFGIGNKNNESVSHRRDSFDMHFNSVRLIQQAASDISDSESGHLYDIPKYQNLPVSSHYAPVPKPRSLIRDISPNHANNASSPVYEYRRTSNENKIQSIPESEIENNIEIQSTRTSRETNRSRLRNTVTDQTKITSKSRSISEPPKQRNDMLIRELKCAQEQLNTVSTKTPRVSKTPSVNEKSPTNSISRDQSKQVKTKSTNRTKKNSPIYENIDITNKITLQKRSSKKDNSSSKAIVDNNERRIYPKNIKNTVQKDEEVAILNENIISEKVEQNTSNKIDDKPEITTYKHLSHKENKTKKHLHNNIRNTDSSQKRHKEQSENESQKCTSENHNKKSANGSRNSSPEKYRIGSRSSDRISSKKDSADRNVKENQESSSGNKSIIEEGEKIEDKIKDTQRIRKRSKSRDTLEVKRRGDKIERSTSKSETKLLESNTTKMDNHESSKDKNKVNAMDSINVKRKSNNKKEKIIINYDDKNGTFSSISKVKHGTSKNQDKPKTIKDTDKENKARSKLRIPLRNAVNKTTKDKQRRQ